MPEFYLGFDTETTGLEPGDHRFVEIYAGLYLPSGRRIWELNQRIDPQRSIPTDVIKVHGITPSDVAGKPTFDQVAPILLNAISKASVLVAHNAEFDMKFVRYELKRVGLTLPEKLKVIDTMAQGMWATPDGKKPSLAELCFACGVPYDPALAHAADYDVKVLMECFFKARRWKVNGKPLFATPSLDDEALADAA